MFLYDVSRLLSRINQPTPTGIDRVDLKYFFFLYEQYEHTYFVYWRKGQLCLINSKLIHQIMLELKKKWLGEKKVTIHHNNFLKSLLKLNDIGEKLSFFSKEDIFSNRLLSLLASKKHHSVMYINTSHTNLDRENVFISLKANLVKIVVLIHDLIPITHPEYCRESEYTKHKVRMDNVVKYADLVLANSEYTRQCFLDYAFKTMGICYKNKVIANRLGTENLAKYMGRSQVSIADKPYFIAIGTIEPRKNYLMLLNLWRELVEDLDIQCPNLYIVGKRGWINTETVAMLERCQNIQPYVHELSNISDADLAHMLKHAQALLMPSYIEGWGLPIAESISLGTKVICSDIPVFHECSNMNAKFISSSYLEKWKQAIIEITVTNPNSKSTNEDISLTNPITWSSHFKKLEDLILPLL